MHVRWRAIASAIVGLAALGLISACGNSDEADDDSQVTIECGAGTNLQNGQCVIQSEGCGPQTILKDGVCEPAAQDVLCGENTTLDQATGTCVPESEIDCGEGTELDGNECRPTGDTKNLEVACQNGLVWDEDDQRCKLAEANCGEGTQLAMNGKCVKSDDICGKNTIFNQETGSCEATGDLCTGDTTFNKQIGGCVSGNIITGDCQSPKTLDSDITSDTNFPTGNCYEVTQEITIKDGATLNISPGVRVGFQDDAGFVVKGDGAALSVNGEQGNRVTLTGKKKNKGHWSGVRFEKAGSADNKLRYAIIEYAGEGGDPAVHLKQQSLLSLKNTRIRNNEGYGFRSEANARSHRKDSPELSAFQSNEFTKNEKGAVHMPTWQTNELDTNSTYAGPNEESRITVTDYGEDIEQSLTWEDLGVPYEVEKFIDITARRSASGSLTLKPGVTVQFQQNAGFELRNGGVLRSSGTENNKVQLTGTEQKRGHWAGIVYEGSTGNELVHTVVEYAGSSGAAVEVDRNGSTDGSSVKIEDSTIQNNAGVGILTRARGVNNFGKFASFKNNTITNNGGIPIRGYVWNIDALDTNSTYSGNDEDWIEIQTADRLERSVTWRNLDVPYRVMETVSIYGRNNADGFLKIEAGTTVEFEQGTGLQAWIEGGLLISGEPNNRVTLTGTDSIKGWWKGLYYEDTNNSLNRISHATIEYGGNAAWDGADAGANITAYEEDTGRTASEATQISLDNVKLENSAGAGIYVLDDNNGNNAETINVKSCSNVSFSSNSTKVASKEQDDIDAFNQACGNP